jgi:hypothetical protein
MSIVADVFEPLLVRHAHHAEPVVAAALAQADLAPHARREDLAAAAGIVSSPAA